MQCEEIPESMSVANVPCAQEANFSGLLHSLKHILCSKNFFIILKQYQDTISPIWQKGTGRKRLVSLFYLEIPLTHLFKNFSQFITLVPSMLQLWPYSLKGTCWHTTCSCLFPEDKGNYWEQRLLLPTESENLESLEYAKRKYQQPEWPKLVIYMYTHTQSNSCYPYHLCLRVVRVVKLFGDSVQGWVQALTLVLKVQAQALSNVLEALGTFSSTW